MKASLLWRIWSVWTVWTLEVGLVEKFAVVEMGGTAGRGKLWSAHAHENSTQWHGSDRKEQATSHSKNTTSMYVAMLISVTKASISLGTRPSFSIFRGSGSETRLACISVEIDGAARTNQVGYITVIARLLGIYGNVNRPCPWASPSDSGRFPAINP